MIEPMQTAGAYGPSGRALETYKHGKAWDLMNQAKQYPAYDQKTCPGGFINLSGALNILMRDWLKDYCDQNMENIRISQGESLVNIRTRVFFTFPFTAL